MDTGSNNRVASPPPNGRLLLGDLVLDKGRRQIRRGDEVLGIPRLSYRLVLVLAEAAPNVLSHDELVQKVWPGRVVSPETVTQRIKLARRALGDDAAAPRYIGLVRGEGYRLLVPVEHLPPEESGVANHLFAELGRRRVLQVALVYAAVAWSITEVVSFLLDALPVFPEWSKALVAILFVVGFPVAMFLAWQFDIGSDGIRRTQAATARGRVTIAAALLLLAGSTAGLFYMIYPRVVDQSGFIAGTGVVRLAPQPNTLAVLPFVNVSGNPDDLYISEGLASALRDQLGRVGDLGVAARSSSVIFRDQLLDATEIAARLGVDKLVEGSLQRDGKVLTVNVQIIDGDTGLQSWADAFDGNTNDLLAIQQDIARALVSALLPDDELSLASAEPATLVASATELMYLADFHYQQVRASPAVDIPTLMRAIDLYRQATVADPQSAIAQSRLGAALLYLGDLDAAERPIFEALAIDPDISEVQYTRGLYLWTQFRPGTGEAHRRAVELDPNNADALEAYGKWIWHQQHTNDAEPYFIRALEVDPMSIGRYSDLGNFYGITGRRDDALAIAEKIPAFFSDANAYIHLARIYELTGDLDEAIGWALRARQLAPGWRDANWAVAELYARIGDFDAAHYFEGEEAVNLLYWKRDYESAIDLAEERVLDQPNQIQIWYLLARSRAALGQYELAIANLESQGLPERVYSESRRSNGIEALVTFADSLNELGQTDRAHEMAEWLADIFQLLIDTGAERAWWPNLYGACAHAILGEDGIALQKLEKTLESPGLVWYPILRDQPCFGKFRGNPRYLAVVEGNDERMRELRQRLPDTLARFQLPKMR